MSVTTHPFDDDRLHEECAVFGIYGHDEAAQHSTLGLHALQHRGQEAAGIVTYDGERFHAHRDLGLVGDIFSDPAVMRRLPGHAAIGHTRYSTTGEPMLRNVQPLFADLDLGGLAIAHNGNLTNARTMRQELVSSGCIFQSTTDTEIIIHLMATTQGTIVERLISAIRRIEGAYSLVTLTKEGLIGVRDPLGVRPLVLGKLDNTYILASESCAFDIVGAERVRDVEPGELLVISEKGVKSYFPFPKLEKRCCIFEFIYFAKPDSVIDGLSIYESRKKIGRELARESRTEADVVVPVPDSGVPAAIGFAAEAGLPYELGIIRNHYVGRTFIEPTSEIRHFGVRLKHNANRAILNGKRVILVDDSIVRGTTSKKIVEMVRAAGATEVHMRISSPPTTNPCFYGVDTPDKDQLLAANLDVDGIRDEIAADSLAFVTIDGLYRAMGEGARDNKRPQFCDACFSGEYPIRLTDQQNGDASAQLSLLSESG
ncbi:MAG TPA: amidophosphoribosyltransferase [Rhodospirillaceae bacterium]|nr:amidophosphoribosyltransferase [Rhodospirillaceae bacterium]MBL25358.1 amidophosphoribosyltransferase [Rhodospirillaceae bacterium]HAT34346.1 amidophosphoribosyltransferase [Rhodospirillaceae bacterium]